MSARHASAAVEVCGGDPVRSEQQLRSRGVVGHVAPSTGGVDVGPRQIERTLGEYVHACVWWHRLDHFIRAYVSAFCLQMHLSMVLVVVAHGNLGPGVAVLASECAREFQNNRS